MVTPPRGSARPEVVARREVVAGPEVVVAGLGLAHPPPIRQDEVWERFFSRHYLGTQHRLAERIFANSGVASRHSAVNPIVEDVSGWSTSQRMVRYLAEALPLGKEAVDKALCAAGTPAADVGLFVVCSCTGYATPGLDILLARDLGMAPDTKRLFVGHMGCYAALPALSVAHDYVTTHRRPALLLCLELTSLHIQPPTRDPQQIVVHALFSDAAAAVVLAPGSSGYVVREVTSVTDTHAADHMTWEVTDLGFRMGLSPKVPSVLSAHVGDMIGDLLARHGHEPSDVDGWAVHPGGPRILDVVRDRLDLPQEAMAASRATLARHGNCSSPTVLLILDALLGRAGRPGTVVMMAFGPGLSLHAALLTAA